jgi:hypothetical protein
VDCGAEAFVINANYVTDIIVGDEIRREQPDKKNALPRVSSPSPG